MIQDSTQKINKHIEILENKVNLILEQQEALQRAVAYLKADIRVVIKETVTEVVNKHAAQGYSKVAVGT